MKNWQGALDYVACMNANEYLGHTDWRLPNVNELESLFHAGWSKECGGAACYNHAQWLETQGFSNVSLSYYWTSTTDVYNYPNSARTVSLSSGNALGQPKTMSGAILPVRDTSSGPAEIWRTGQATIFSSAGNFLVDF